MKMPVSVGCDKWSASDHEGKEHADDVDICALPGATLVLVRIL